MKILGLFLLVMLAPYVSFAEEQTWYLVRHFEKQKEDNPSLTAQGQARAEALALFFAELPLKHVYSTSYNRALETAKPAASAQNLQVELYDPSDLEGFSEALKQQNNVLIVGHSNTTPALLELLGGINVSIDESEYGVLYIVHKNGAHLSTTTRNILSN